MSRFPSREWPAIPKRRLVVRAVTTGVSLSFAFAITWLSSPAGAQDQSQQATQSPQPAAEAPRSASVQPAAEAPQDVEEVIVRGQRMSEIENNLRVYVRKFVTQITALPNEQGYARWQRTVCVGVHNLRQDAAQYIVDRISELAVDVGLEPGEPGCLADVLVIFATNAKQLATTLVDQQEVMFRPSKVLGNMTLDRTALDHFATNDKPVRWWHVSMPVDPHNGLPAIRLPTDETAPTIMVEGPSRIHNGTRDDLKRVIIIVDPTKLHGTTWQQIADYLGVVSLAQIDPDADPSAFDSILNLFSNPKAYSGLTDWDKSFLHALYSIDLERKRHFQTNEVVAAMAKQELQKINK
jgi:hypothetical protein